TTTRKIAATCFIVALQLIMRIDAEIHSIYLLTQGWSHIIRSSDADREVSHRENSENNFQSFSLEYSSKNTFRTYNSPKHCCRRPQSDGRARCIKIHAMVLALSLIAGEQRSYPMKGVLVSGPASGAGKTTVSAAFMAALRKRHLIVQ